MQASQPIPADQQAQLDIAKQELSKLPALGPVVWLFSRDPNRRYTFFADIDWRLLPPMVLNQHALFTKEELPWAYFSWAMVSPEVDQRLKSSTPIIAPHEWKGGTIPWLIDVVMPYGYEEPLIKQAIEKFAPKQLVNALVFDTAGKLTVRTIQG